MYDVLMIQIAYDLSRFSGVAMPVIDLFRPGQEIFILCQKEGAHIQV